jgi:hypothetical protein
MSIQDDWAASFNCETTPADLRAAEDEAYAEYLRTVELAEPSEADWSDFRMWSAMADARRSIEAMPTFLAKIGAACDMFRDSHDADLVWLGDRIGELYDRARAVDATSGAQAQDRWDAVEDSR